MKVKKTFFSFLFFASLAAGATAQSGAEKFETFLDRFTASAAFQYSRVKFPLESPITLIAENGDEKTYPLTKERWPLLDAASFKVERVMQEEGAVYLAHYVLDEAGQKEYEAGYEESELDLRVVFKLIGGKWFVTDCYNSWYGFDLPIEEFADTVKQVQEENKVFREEHP